jgi:hypothetical protein
MKYSIGIAVAAVQHQFPAKMSMYQETNGINCIQFVCLSLNLAITPSQHHHQEV